MTYSHLYHIDQQRLGIILVPYLCEFLAASLIYRPMSEKMKVLLPSRPALYSATREDDTTFIFSHFGLFLSDAASNSHK